MDCVTLCRNLLLLILILKQTDAFPDQCRDKMEERDRLQQEIKNIRDLKNRNEERARLCMVRGH